MTADRMLRIALTEFRKVEKLERCDPVTIIGAIVMASQLGLEPGSGLGHCFLVPYYNNRRETYECQLIPGYKGLVELARRSGQVHDVYSRVVYKNDVFDYDYGLDQKLVHKPAEGDRGEMTHVYAVVKYKNGGSGFEVMSKASVEKARDSLKNKNPVWKDHFDEMARKTVVRKLAKYMPMSPELVQMQELDNANCDDESQDLHKTAIDIGVIEAGYEPHYELSADATTGAKINDELASEGREENLATMRNLVISRLADLTRQGKPEQDLQAAIGVKIPLGKIDWTKYSVNQLTAMALALK